MRVKLFKGIKSPRCRKSKTGELDSSMAKLWINGGKSKFTRSKMDKDKSMRATCISKEAKPRWLKERRNKLGSRCRRSKTSMKDSKRAVDLRSIKNPDETKSKAEKDESQRTKPKLEEENPGHERLRGNMKGPRCKKSGANDARPA